MERIILDLSELMGWREEKSKPENKQKKLIKLNIITRCKTQYDVGTISFEEESHENKMINIMLNKIS